MKIKETKTARLLITRLAVQVRLGEPKENKPLQLIAARAFFVGLPVCYYHGTAAAKPHNNKRARKLALICTQVGTRERIKSGDLAPLWC